MRQHAAQALLVTGLLAYVPALLLGLWWAASGALTLLLTVIR